MDSGRHEDYYQTDFDTDKADSSPFLSSYTNKQDVEAELKPAIHSSGRLVLVILPWVTTMFFALTTILLLKQKHVSFWGSYEAGFTTDFITPSKIPLEKTRFTGSPNFHHNGTPWRNPIDESAAWPESMKLFGTPSSEIDHNWEILIGRRYVSISEEEAARAWGEKRHEYVDERLGGYTAGLDVFHNLHCVNSLRKGLRPEYYKIVSSHNALHNEHCLDIIRQSLQCSGSTTLIPTRFMEGLQHNYIDSDQVHTCRSFTFLRNWTNSRHHEGSDYIERNLDLVDEKKFGIANEYARTHDAEHVEGGPVP